MQLPDDDELSALLRREARRHVPPPALADRVRDALRETQAEPQAGRARPSAGRWQWLKALALFGAGAATAWGLTLGVFLAPALGSGADAVTDAHVRSLMAEHLTDVASSDHHTVKPWFAGRLDFSPPVVDLASAGRPLVGGRLEYIDGRPAAALVYRSGQHLVNLFVWPAGKAASQAPQFLSRRGYNLVRWTEGGMQVWAVSDLNAAELQAFAGLARERMAAEVPPAR